MIKLFHTPLPWHRPAPDPPIDAEAYNAAAILAMRRNFRPETATDPQPIQESALSTSATVPAVSKPSFFARVKAELHKLFTHIPGWEASAAATLTYLAPMVETVLTLADPAAAPVVTALIEKVQSAMAASAVVIKDAGPTPTLLTYLSAINADIAQIESAAGVKDSATAAKLTAITGTITGEINAIIAEVQSGSAK